MTVAAAQTGLKLTSKIKILGRIWCPESRQKRGQGQSEDWVDTYTVRLLCFVVMLEGVLFILLLWPLSVCLRCMCGMHTCSCQGVCVEAGEQFSGVTFLFHLACIMVYTPGSLAREPGPASAQSPCFCFLSLREKAEITEVCQS